MTRPPRISVHDNQNIGTDTCEPTSHRRISGDRAPPCNTRTRGAINAGGVCPSTTGHWVIRGGDDGGLAVRCTDGGAQIPPAGRPVHGGAHQPGLRIRGRRRRPGGQLDRRGRPRRRHPLPPRRRRPAEPAHHRRRPRHVRGRTRCRDDRRWPPRLCPRSARHVRHRPEIGLVEPGLRADGGQPDPQVPSRGPPVGDGTRPRGFPLRHRRTPLRPVADRPLSRLPDHLAGHRDPLGRHQGLPAQCRRRPDRTLSGPHHRPARAPSRRATASLPVPRRFQHHHRRRGHPHRGHLRELRCRGLESVRLPRRGPSRISAHLRRRAGRPRPRSADRPHLARQIVTERIQIVRQRAGSPGFLLLPQ